MSDQNWAGWESSSSCLDGALASLCTAFPAEERDRLARAIRELDEAVAERLALARERGMTDPAEVRAYVARIQAVLEHATAAVRTAAEVVDAFELAAMVLRTEPSAEHASVGPDVSAKRPTCIGSRGPR